MKQNPDIIIRKAQTKDIPQLVRLYSNVHEIIDYSNQKHDKKYFLNCLRSNTLRIIIAEIEKKICGATVAEFEEIMKYTYWSKIVVSPKCRGQGIGSLLMKAVEQESRERHIKRIFGLVYDWNKNMQKIMKHNKFKSQGKTIVYSKEL
ncbi:MAG: GNAT family N-acetyltransferase [Candidatus Woesearchaeota archaeon]